MKTLNVLTFLNLLEKFVEHSLQYFLWNFLNFFCDVALVHATLLGESDKNLEFEITPQETKLQIVKSGDRAGHGM